MKQHTPLACPLAVLACWATISAPLHAATLGSIKVSSALGDRFNAIVSVSVTENERISPACFQLVTPRETDDVRFLRNAQIEYSRTASGGEAQIIGSEYEREPLLKLALQLRCPEDDVRGFTREYNVLLDPREYKNPAIALNNSKANPPEDRAVLASKPAPSGINPAPRSSTRSSTSNSKAVAPAPENTSKRKARSKAQPPSTPQPEEFRLQLSSASLSPAHTALQLSDDEKNQLRERLLLIESDDQNAQMLQLKDRIMRLEKQLSNLQLATANASAPQSAKKASQTGIAKDSLHTEESISAWLWAGLALLLLFPLGFFWHRRQERQKELQSQFEFDAEQENPSEQFVESGKNSVLALDEQFSSRKKSPTPSEGWGNEHMDVVSPGNIAEEAQLLLAHGLTQQAADLLVQEINFRPNSLALWMKLFTIYRDTQDTAGFETQAQAFRTHFVSNSLWEQVQSMGREIDTDNALYMAAEEEITIETPTTPPSGNDDFDITELMSKKPAEPIAADHTAAKDDLLFPLDFHRPEPLTEEEPQDTALHEEPQTDANDIELFSFDIPSLELPMPEISDVPQTFSAEDFASDDSTLQDIAHTILSGQPEHAYQQLEELLYRGTFEQRLIAAKWLDKLLPVKG